jgi:hypothetical protein
MRTRTLTTTCVALALGAAGLTACGGDEGLSKAEYLKQGNALCRQANADLKKIAPPSDLAGLKDYVTKAKGVTTKAVDKLDALEPPEDLRADHDAHVADGRKVIAMADRLGDAAASQDQAAFERLTKEGDRMDEVSDKRAERMGLTDCAEDA